MDNVIDSIRLFFFNQRTLDILQALLVIILGFIVARLLADFVQKSLKSRFAPHALQLIRRAAFYGILGLFAFSAMRQLGFDLSVVLGAAGIFSVAIGFASQTSASNLISGLFLLAERPFSVGDIIKVGNTTGEVLSIDLLSMKLRTFDNLYVRIPNESLIKSEVVTLTKYQIRRFDMQLGVAYKEDLTKVEELLLRVAEKEPLCLEEPKPLFIFLGFGASSQDIQFSVWARRENFLDLKNKMFKAVKKCFDENDIEIPFPHVSVYSGSASKSFPVHVESRQFEHIAEEPWDKEK